MNENTRVSSRAADRGGAGRTLQERNSRTSSALASLYCAIADWFGVGCSTGMFVSVELQGMHLSAPFSGVDPVNILG